MKYNIKVTTYRDMLWVYEGATSYVVDGFGNLSLTDKDGYRHTFKKRYLVKYSVKEVS